MKEKLFPTEDPVDAVIGPAAVGAVEICSGDGATPQDSGDGRNARSTGLVANAILLRVQN